MRHGKGCGIVGDASVEIFRFDRRSRRDDFDDFAFGQAFAVRNFPDLFADDDFFTKPQKTGDIHFRRVIRDAAHRSVTSVRQRQVQKTRYFYRIPVEHFIKIAETEKQHFVFILRFYGSILRHERRRRVFRLHAANFFRAPKSLGR